jgi:hypothetical protein
VSRRTRRRLLAAIVAVLLASPARAETVAAKPSLPADLPLYAQATRTSAMSSAAGGTVVNLQTSDAPDAVFAWYRDAFVTQGWRVEQQDAASGRHLVTALKDSRKASVLISGRDGATSILVSMVEAK